MTLRDLEDLTRDFPLPRGRGMRAAMATKRAAVAYRDKCEAETGRRFQVVVVWPTRALRVCLDSFESFEVASAEVAS